MNLIKLYVIYLTAFSWLFIFNIENSSAQDSHSGETSEMIYEHWFFALGNVKQNTKTDKKDFEIFTRFSSKSIDSLRGDFLKRIGTHEVTLNNVENYESILTSNLTILYEKYMALKKEFPSSIDEFRASDKPGYLTATCDSACNNIDFENGTLSGWNAYYGYNSSGTASTYITNIVGGAAGAVTEAADDNLTSTPGYYNTTVGPNPNPDYQVSITSGTRSDAIVNGVPVVSPFGGHYSVMLGDSTEVNYGVAILSQTFLVATSNANFTYQYAVFLANPTHNYYQQPFFKIAFIDQAGDTIPFCGQYNVVSGHGTQQFDSIPYHDPIINQTYTVYYKNWTTVNVPLKHYIGQCITVVFEVADCSLGGHFGYAYIDASCSPLDVVNSSPAFCGQDSITLTGPSGESGYLWSGPQNGIISSDTSRIIQVDSSGTYTLVVTPVTGSTCNDTITISIGKEPGPPPHPNFTADTVCVGSPTSFTNLSNPIAGGSFYWDFYNIGTYQDSSANPTWTYNLPGTYTVKLDEIVNGCGSDTLITIVVDRPVTSSFTIKNGCAGDTIFFTNTSIGANSYQWNFGEPSSGNNNSSTAANPYHIYDTVGTTNITLIAFNSGKCSDTVEESIVIFPEGRSTTGPEVICAGGFADITSVAGKSYLWNNGYTTSTASVNPGSTTTYYCIVVNSNGCKDTTYNTVMVNPAPVLTACCDTTLNPSGSAQLTATGTGIFSWFPSTSLSCTNCNDPVASPVSTTAYTVTLTNDSGCTASQVITIDVSCGEVFIPDIFSPDNPAHNNILYVRSPCIKEMEFLIFDRWGNKVFESESEDIGWDGRHNHVSMNAGTYVWYLKTTMTDGEHINKKGNVTLVR